MSTALAPAPSKIRFGLPGRPETLDYKVGATVGGYLKELGATIPAGHVPVGGGRPATEDTIVPEGAAVTVAYKPENG